MKQILLCIMAVLMASCHHNGDRPVEMRDYIIGKWLFQYSENKSYYPGWTQMLVGYHHDFGLLFRSDNTGYVSDDFIGHRTPERDRDFRWEIEGDTLYIHMNSDKDIYFDSNDEPDYSYRIYNDSSHPLVLEKLNDRYIFVKLPSW